MDKFPSTLRAEYTRVDVNKAELHRRLQRREHQVLSLYKGYAGGAGLRNGGGSQQLSWHRDLSKVTLASGDDK